LLHEPAAFRRKTSTKDSIMKALLAILALVSTTVVLTAGPGPQYWNKTTATKTGTTVIAAAPTCSTCACCKKM
jgi:hypothetical protein